jgi:hypothetical protein
MYLRCVVCSRDLGTNDNSCQKTILRTHAGEPNAKAVAFIFANSVEISTFWGDNEVIATIEHASGFMVDLATTLNQCDTTFESS